MKTKTKAITGMAAMLVIASLLFAYPAFASQGSGIAANTSQAQAVSSTTTTTSNTQQLPASNAKACAHCKRPDLHVGSTLTYTTLSGIYWTPGHPNENGTGAVSLQFTVTGVFDKGYSLSLTSGTIALGATTYSLSSGSAELGPYGEFMVGQLAGSGGFQAIFRVNNLGNFGSASYATIRMDLNNGSGEYYLRAMTTVAVA